MIPERKLKQVEPQSSTGEFRQNGPSIQFKGTICNPTVKSGAKKN